jgi:hypothetical protein
MVSRRGFGMAIRKTGSRRIVVDGVEYRWRIRRRATYSQIDYGSGTLHVAIESAEQAGAVLVLITDRPHPQDCVPRRLMPATPSDVAGWVRQAIRAGWMPSKPGPQFSLRLSVSSIKRIG